MAWLSSGKAGERYKCNVCLNNPAMQKVWGCEEKTQMFQPTFIWEDNGTEYRLWNCPIQFIPLSISDFNKHYNYIKNFKTEMPDYKFVNKKFLNAIAYYENELTEYIKEG